MKKYLLFVHKDGDVFEMIEKTLDITKYFVSDYDEFYKIQLINEMLKDLKKNSHHVVCGDVNLNIIGEFLNKMQKQDKRIKFAAFDEEFNTMLFNE